MLIKTKFAFAAAFVIASASAALSYEEPDNKIGDRYPFLEQSAPMHAGRMIAARQVASVRPVSYEDPENRVADRYPMLEQSAGPMLVTSRSVRAVSMRQASVRLGSPVEDVENRIGDRYPTLEPVNPRRAAANVTTASRHIRHSKKV